jgi:hypothetical protein
MGKRSDFERKPRDYYQTPIEALEPLLEHLPKAFDFAEPCAGDGVLVNHIETLVDGAVCTWASDIEPQNKDVLKYDYSTLTSYELEESEYIIFLSLNLLGYYLMLIGLTLNSLHHI